MTKSTEMSALRAIVLLLMGGVSLVMTIMFCFYMWSGASDEVRTWQYGYAGVLLMYLYSLVERK